VPLDHIEGGLTFGPAGCRRRVRLHDQAVAVFGERVPDEAELGCRMVALAVKLRVGISRRGVRVVRALLAVELTLAVASRRWWLVRAILGAHALQ